MRQDYCILRSSSGGYMHMHTEEMASDHGANVPERASGFRPTAWGDFFINYSPDPLQAWLYMYIFNL